MGQHEDEPSNLTASRRPGKNKHASIYGETPLSRDEVQAVGHFLHVNEQVIPLTPEYIVLSFTSILFTL